MEHTKTFELLYSPDYLPPTEEPGEKQPRLCPGCGMPTQKEVELAGVGRRLVTVQCRCSREKLLEESRLRRREEFELELQRMHQRDRLSDNQHESHRFASSDGHDPQAFEICRRYVDNWEKMRENNMGMLLYGTVGAGKTYMAGCMVNGLRERLVPATVTSFPRLLNLLQDSRDRQGLLDSMNRYELLVIDDLGAERNSAYALEQVYNITDSRAKSGKPLVITTNLSLQELKKPESLAYARIYDRILELCPITLKMTGDSRRAARAREKRDLAREILMG